MQVITTDGIREDRRVRFWQDAVCDALVDLNIESCQVGGFAASLQLASAGDSVFCRIDSTTQRVVRTRKHIARSTAAFFHIPMQLKGRSRVSQRGASFDLQPGEFALFNSTEPYELEFDRAFSQIVLQIPQSSLRNAFAIDGFVGGIPVKGQNALGRLVLNEITATLSALDEIDADVAAALARHNIDLIALAVNSSLRLQLGTGSSGRRALTQRVLAIAEERLSDHTVSLDSIAISAGISVRTLHEIFASLDTTPWRWMQQRRLEQCRRDLRDGLLDSMSITTIALKWGFNSPAHFARAYRQYFGCTPRSERKSIRDN